MTALSKIVRLFECDSPELPTLFVPDYRRVLLRKIKLRELEGTKMLVERYLIKHLRDSLVNYKLFSYKVQDGIIIEILLKPKDTANIVEYYLHIYSDKCFLERVK